MNRSVAPTVSLAATAVVGVRVSVGGRVCRGVLGEWLGDLVGRGDGDPGGGLDVAGGPEGGGLAVPGGWLGAGLVDGLGLAVPGG